MEVGISDAPASREEPTVDDHGSGGDVPAAGDERPDDDGDDVILLSWWQHPVNVIGLVVAAALIAGMLAWLVADTRAETAGGEVDVGFLHDMRAHHEQAVQMGFMYLALPDTDPRLRTVARSIVFGQGIDIGRMIQLLRDIGAPEAAESEEAMAWMGMPTSVDEMPGMASSDELDRLGGSTGAEADRVFVDLMAAHHEGALHMAEVAAADADNAEVRAMAASIAASQRDEIGELERLVD